MKEIVNINGYNYRWLTLEDVDRIHEQSKKWNHNGRRYPDNMSAKAFMEDWIGVNDQQIIRNTKLSNYVRET